MAMGIFLCTCRQVWFQFVVEYNLQYNLQYMYSIGTLASVVCLFMSLPLSTSSHDLMHSLFLVEQLLSTLDESNLPLAEQIMNNLLGRQVDQNYMVRMYCIRGLGNMADIKGNEVHSIIINFRQTYIISKTYVDTLTPLIQQDTPLIYIYILLNEETSF